MERLRAKLGAFEYKGLAVIALLFVGIAVVLFLERSGIQIQYNKLSLPWLSAEEVVPKVQALAAQEERDCLMLYQSELEESAQALEQFEQILTDMKVSHDTVDLSAGEDFGFAGYETAILLINDLSVLEDKLMELDQWVYDGGGALLPMTMAKESYFMVMENKFGILESSYEYTLVDSIYVTEDFMIGGGRSFAITDPWDSALQVQLQNADGVQLHAYTGDERRVPLIWESRYGQGKFVLDNFGLYTKEVRGFYAASYTLLQDVVAYPVINGSCFYLDDFPSQVPLGASEYIWRDYGISTRDYYTNVWWPDMMNLADQYGLKYTGLAILCYDDYVDGSTPSQPDKHTFMKFGNMLLRMGGEIGYHGYNHQPLCLDDCDYHGLFDYKTWDSEAAMESAMDRLIELCAELFPGVQISVYVPPSNIMSDGAEDFLAETYPEIRSISGVYIGMDDLDFYCDQEFDVRPDGVVEQPRIISGCDIDDYMQMAAISELNLHYVNSHFTHPDDALDPDRGAELGWEELKRRFISYLDWLYTAAPNLRDFTGSEMAAAVQRYASLTVSTEVGEDEMVLHLGNFTDEAQLLVRFNDASPGQVTGGTLEQLTGSLYLIQAQQDEVTITLE